MNILIILIKLSDGNCYVWVVLFFGFKRVNDKLKNMWKMDFYRGGNEIN